jgi:thiosulfate/3-mercaptopyruvate sulfurtransferase
MNADYRAVLLYSARMHTTLVATAALAAHLDDPRWVVFDCRHDLARPEAGREAYLKSHIPGARFMHMDADLSGPPTGRNGRHPLPDPAVLAAKLGAAGVGAGSQVVAYDDRAGVNSARLWWLVRWLGHEAVAVLDGGLVKWRHEGRPETAALPSVQSAAFAPRPRPAAVSVDFIATHLRDPAVRVVDARSAERYRGEAEPIDPVAGHIPGAINRFVGENLAAGVFKPQAQLRAEWQALLGGMPAAGVVHSCGSGVAACHNLLAMEIAGLAGSRLYPGSWSEWCADPRRPYVTGRYP